MEVNNIYMERALALAAHGMGYVSPNPMVGAVITAPDGRIIGEGYHRRWGGAHAEVNAIQSVKERSQLADSTLYVTLEPCSHYGKTPPCARLIIDTGIPRVVIGAGDPNPLVAGRGVAMLRDAGVEVVEGILERECRQLNVRFMTAQSLRRPFITLKWAQSADGFIDSAPTPDSRQPYRFSTCLSSMAVHRLRSLHDAILVGSGTVLADNPSLNVRLWSGRQPRPVILDRRGRVSLEKAVFRNGRSPLVINAYDDLEALMHKLFNDEGISSVLVEGGAAVLQSFIDAGLWDAARVETSPVILGAHGGTRAPMLGAPPQSSIRYGNNTVSFYSHNGISDVKNL